MIEDKVDYNNMFVIGRLIPGRIPAGSVIYRMNESSFLESCENRNTTSDATLLDTRPSVTVASAPPAPAHVASLDGLRAIAIMAVMAVHSGFPGASLGFLGVDLFFVLSGFLITTLLLAEYSRSGTISLTKFWGRRFLRLMPAYWLYAIFLTSAMVVFHWGTLSTHGGWTPRYYIASIWLYFVNYAPQGGIWSLQAFALHLWSLAVEEQFYFCWPVLLFMALKLRFAEPMAWTLAAAILVHTLGTEWFIPFRLYTQGLGIVLGCAFAIRAYHSPTFRAQLAKSWVGIGMIAGIIVVTTVATIAFVRGNVTVDDVHRYWTPGLAVGFALLIGKLWYAPMDRIAQALTWRPMVYIGKISYGMYLYHMLAHFLTWEILLAGIEGWNRFPKFGLRMVVFSLLTLGIASLSYFTIERPFLALKSRLR